MFKLRDYQLDLVDRVWAQLGSDSAVLAQLPTGGGKTACQAELARRLFRFGGKVLAAVHRVEVLHQMAAAFEYHIGITPQLVVAGSRPDWNAPVILGMNQTLVRRIDSLPGDIRLLIQDEAHHSTSRTYRKLFDALNCNVSGWSATPERLDGSALSDVFDCLVLGPSVKQLTAWGFLCPYRYHSLDVGMTTRGVKVRNGDYDARGLARANKATAIAAEVVKNYRAHANGLQTVVFAINVAHSQQIAWSLAEAGINAVHVDGNTPAAERAQAIADFKAGRVQVLCNCELFGEGVDIPAVEAVVLARPTQSLTIFLQQVGRCLRPFPGKDYAVILDLAPNCATHGFPDDHRAWKFDGEVKEPGPGRFFGLEERAYTPRDTSEGNATITEVARSDINPDHPWAETINRLLYRQQLLGYKRGWLGYGLAEDPVASLDLSAWELLGQYLGYKPGWAWHKWHETRSRSAA